MTWVSDPRALARSATPSVPLPQNPVIAAGPIERAGRFRRIGYRRGAVLGECMPTEAMKEIKDGEDIECDLYP